MRHLSRVTAQIAVLVIVSLLLPSIAGAQNRSANDMVVTTTWLAEHLSDPQLVLVWTGGTAPAQLIPGSRALPHERVMTMSAGQDLPPVDDLVATLRRVSISDASHVVIYGEPMAAGWLFLALDYIGH